MDFGLSVLDVSPVSSGSNGAQALRNTLELARLADRLGYERYWLAEHHNLPTIASSAPEIMIGHVANVTERIRVGAGGIMLPNHAPLKVSETFRVLESLHPKRIDLGIGRAPGTDPVTATALRRSHDGLGAEDFPERFGELLAFSGDGFPEDHPFQSVVAMPADVVSVFGRRTNSRVRFWLRRARALEVYARVIDEVRARQQKAAAAMPPPPEVPLPPAPPPPPTEPPPITP